MDAHTRVRPCPRVRVPPLLLRRLRKSRVLRRSAENFRSRPVCLGFAQPVHCERKSHGWAKSLLVYSGFGDKQFTVLFTPIVRRAICTGDGRYGWPTRVCRKKMVGHLFFSATGDLGSDDTNCGP